MTSLLEIQRMLQNFSLDRPTLSENNTPQRIIELLQNEVVEASQSLADTDNLASEVADVIILALTLANKYGFDMDQEVREKITLNLIRFPASKFKDGDYEESRRECKAAEKPIIEEFYQIPR